MGPGEGVFAFNFERFPNHQGIVDANQADGTPCPIAVARCGGRDDSMKCKRRHDPGLSVRRQDKMVWARLLTPEQFVTQCGEDGICEFKQCRMIFGWQRQIVHQRQGIFNALPE
ncbi:hypothetical protein PQR75_41355 [Paraburkholderia fungorum]|uniref:hypothetical protein n=1 Tax=Paraburkholderia fungorum TaxID=134537 RepID=UPI0038BAB098